MDCETGTAIWNLNLFGIGFHLSKKIPNNHYYLEQYFQFYVLLSTAFIYILRSSPFPLLMSSNLRIDSQCFPVYKDILQPAEACSSRNSIPLTRYFTAHNIFYLSEQLNTLFNCYILNATYFFETNIYIPEKCKKMFNSRKTLHLPWILI